MAVYRTALTDLREVEIDAGESVGAGGEKTAFLTLDRSQVVLLFNQGLRDRAGRLRHLERILHRYNPATGQHAKFWKAHFRWPEGMIDGGAGLPAEFLRRHQLLQPATGVVVPVIEPNYYFRTAHGSRLKSATWFTGEKARRFVPDAEKGSLAGLVQCAAMLARGVRRLHFAGLAHGDLSGKNVVIDPCTGESCLFDLDSLVIPGVSSEGFTGTAGYMAPELVAGQGRPSIEADRHALAVLIYEMLLRRHPLLGSKMWSETPEEDERLGLGDKALFIEHPEDRSNALPVPPLIPYTRLGPHLVSLIRRAFIEALHAPSRRPTADDWEKALYRTVDLLMPVPGEKDWMVLAPGMPMRSPWTLQPLTAPVPFAHFYRRSRHAPQEFLPEPSLQGLTIYHGLRLQPWHLCNIQPGEMSAEDPQGYFAFENGAWYLVSESDEIMQLSDGRILRRGDFTTLTEGLSVIMSPGPEARQFRFAFLPPTIPS